MNDTIAAISTALGVGAISIIRLSGPDAIKIVNKIYDKKNLDQKASHTINYGYIINNGEKIDEVLISIMKAPKTFTTEDIVEINCHGGISTTKKILEILLQNGCRLAEPGEFTKRAFLNGRIDLLEAEGVMDLINSTTEKERKLALNQVNGNTSKKVKNIINKIIEVLAHINVNIDYPEYDDIPEITNKDVLNKIEEIENELLQVLSNSEDGKIIKDGIKVAIIGRPNVGKSSLLNCLLEENKAIVTDIAGTTRDIVEGSIIIDGIKLNIIDTAGIRKTEDLVESIGVTKSLETLKEADLVLYLLNNNEKIIEEDMNIINSIQNKNHIIIINKKDLEQKLNLDKINTKNTIYISVLNHEGIDELKNKIKEMFNLEKFDTQDLTYLTNARTINLIKEAIESFKSAKSSLKINAPIDMIAIDLKEVCEYLGQITGDSYSDKLIDELFSKFCLGK